MAKGKWADIVGRLLKLPAEYMDGGNDYQQRINMKKTEIGPLKLSELAAEYVKLREKEDDLEAQAKANRLHLRAVEQLMEEAFEAEGLKKLDLANGKSVAYQPEPVIYVKDKSEFYGWCDKTPEMKEALENTRANASFMWSTINALGKRFLEAGKDLPPGLEVFAKPKFVLR